MRTFGCIAAPELEFASAEKWSDSTEGARVGRPGYRGFCDESDEASASSTPVEDAIVGQEKRLTGDMRHGSITKRKFTMTFAKMSRSFPCGHPALAYIMNDFIIFCTVHRPWHIFPNGRSTG